MKRKRLTEEEQMLATFDDLHERLLERNVIPPEVIDECIEKAGDLKAPYFRTLFVFLQGVSKFNQAQYTEALALFRSCMEQLEQSDSIYNKLLYWTGKAAYITGDLIEAVNYLKRSVLGFAHAKDEDWEIRTNNLLGGVFLNMGFFDEALNIQDACMKYYSAKKDFKTLSTIFVDLGNTYRQLKMYEEGEKNFNRAVEIMNQHPDDFNDTFRGNCYKHFGDLYLPENKLEQAMIQYQHFLDLNTELIHPFLLTSFYLSYGVALRQMQNYEKALHYSQLCVDKAKTLHAQKLVEGALKNIGQTYLDAGNLKKAESILVHALKESEATGSALWQSETHQQLYMLYKKKSNPAKALVHYERFHLLKEESLTEDANIRVSALKALNEAVQAQRKLQETENQLSLRRQELDLTVLHLQQKDLVIKSVKQALDGLKKEKLLKGKAIALLSKKLEQSLVSITENDSFKEKINDATRNFVHVLRRKFPAVTKREAEIAALLNKGMSSKEIAELVLVDIRAVEQTRYRLRKRLGLKTGDDLALALIKLLPLR